VGVMFVVSILEICLSLSGLSEEKKPCWELQNSKMLNIALIFNERVLYGREKGNK